MGTIKKLMQYLHSFIISWKFITISFNKFIYCIHIKSFNDSLSFLPIIITEQKIFKKLYVSVY